VQGVSTCISVLACAGESGESIVRVHYPGKASISAVTSSSYFMTNTRYHAVDHVMLRLLDVEPLLSLFGTTFDLPISWPKQTSSFATLAWVHVGNTDLEFWAATSNADLPLDSQPPLFHGFALDPVDLTTCIADLAKDGIQCKSPRPYQTEGAGGTLVTNFTNSVVLDLSSASCCVFFCAWEPEGTIFPWAERLTAAARRSRDQKELVKRKGGPLGLVGLSTIEMSAPTLETTLEKWRTFTRSRGRQLALTADIDLHLVPGTHHKIQSLTFDVKSLEAAKTFLISKNLLGVSSANELTLATHATAGLKFSFIEAKSNRLEHTH